MILVLLPGMDGTGLLFEEFVTRLPEGVEARIVRYPQDRRLSYEELTGRVRSELPTASPNALVAESYSGPVAIALGAEPVGNLRSIISHPLGALGTCISLLSLALLLRIPVPKWFVRWLLLERSTAPELLLAVQNAIRRVPADVLAFRIRDAIRVDSGERLDRCSGPVVCLIADNDRLLSRSSIAQLHRMHSLNIRTVSAPHLLLQCAPDAAIAEIRRCGLISPAT